MFHGQMRDLHAIGVKLKCVLVPKVGDEEETLKQLRDCKSDIYIHTFSNNIYFVQKGICGDL